METEPIDFVLAVDLDGVCADFAGGLRSIAAEWLDVDVSTLSQEPTVDYPEWNLDAAGGFDDLYHYAVTRRELFSKLPPVEGAAVTLRRLWTKTRLRIRIVTYRLYFPFFHQTVVSQTVGWLDRNGFPYWDLCFMKDKPAVGADLYIEDSWRNVKELRSAARETIMFVTSQNRHITEGLRAESWKDVEPLVLERVALRV